MIKNNTLILTKAMFNNDETLSSMTGRAKKKSFFQSRWVKVLSFIFLLGILSISFGSILSELFDSLAMVQMETIILRLLIPAAGFMVFVFGIFYVMNVFYFSKDIENYLYLPVKAGEILNAKFLVSLIYEYFIILLFFLPMLVVYGYKAGASVVYYIYMILTLLIVPIFPLVVASIIAMVIMRFSDKFKNKDRFNMVAGVLSLAVALGFNFGIQFISNRVSGDQAASIGDIKDLAIFKITSWVFPTSGFATEALISFREFSGLINLLIMIGITLLSLIVFYMVGNSIYFKGVTGISESSANRRDLTKEQLVKGTKKRSILLAYSLKELKLLLRTPVYFLNCVLISLIYPLFFLLPFIAGGAATDGVSLDQVFFALRKINPGLILLGMVGAGFLLGSVNSISSTAISREGKNLYFMKYIPVPYTTQIYSKILSAFYVESAGLLILYGILYYIFRVDFWFIILSLIVVLLASMFIYQVGIYIDLSRPKLNWDTEQKAVKQNLNSVIHIFTGFALIAVCIILAIYFDPSFFISFMTSFLILSILVLVMHVLLERKTRKKMKVLS